MTELPRRAARFMRHALPQRCALCAAPCADRLVCAPCDAALPRVPSPCPLCALASRGGALCGACLARPPPFGAAIAAFAYAFPVDRLLHALKYGARLALADWAAESLALPVGTSAASVEAIVALPLSAERQRERGFNQAHEIARRLASRLRLPVAALLVRVGQGPPQAMLPWAARAANVRGAFACVADVRGRRIAIVDDVMTTGATLAEAARTLHAAGAARVDAWVVARTPPPGDAQ